MKTECAKFAVVKFLVCIRKPWLAAISHPNPSIVLSHGLSRLASRKDCKSAVRDSKPRLWSLRGSTCLSIYLVVSSILFFVAIVSDELKIVSNSISEYASDAGFQPEETGGRV